MQGGVRLRQEYARQSEVEAGCARQSKGEAKCARERELEAE